MKKPQITEELRTAVKMVLNAKAYADTIRPTIEKIQQTILDAFQFPVDPKYRKEGKHIPEIVTRNFDNYLMSEADAKAYTDLLHEEYKKAGFDVEYGYCPLLIAENLEREAKREMVRASAYIAKDHGITDINQLLYGKLELLYKYHNLIIGLVVSLTPPDYFTLDNAEDILTV